MVDKMYLLLLNGKTNRQMRRCSTDCNDILDELLDLVLAGEVPKRIYNIIKEFMWKTDQKVLQLPDKYGIVRVVTHPEKLYAKYQLEWMIEHGYSIEDFLTELQKYYDYFRDNEMCFVPLIFKYIYYEWLCDKGFEGEIWSCYDEWCHNELFDMFDM